MRIDRIRLTDFKRHHELEIEPDAGLTIIRGPNEAGKSSLQQALELGLYRKADANREDIRQAWSWGSDTPPTVELDFDADGEAVTLRKRFGGSRAEAEMTFAGQSIRDYDRIGETIADITGIPTERFFRATASVGHAELAGVDTNEPILGDRLQTAISGADRGTAQAKKKLETAVRRYRSEGNKHPGLLKMARADVASLEAELAEGEKALGRLATDRAAWVEADDRRRALDVELERQEGALDEASRALAMAQERDAAQDRYERLRRASELVEQRDKLESELPTAMPLSSLRAGVARATTLELELSELEADIDAENAAVESDVADADTVPRGPTRWLLLAVGMVALSAVAWFVLGGVIGALLGIVILAAMVGVLVQAWRVARKRRQYALAQQLAATSVAERHDQVRSREDDFRRVRRDLENTLTELGVDDVTQATAVLASTEEHTEVLSGLEGELRGLGVEDRSLRRLTESRDQAANEAAQASHGLSGMGSLADDPGAAHAAAQREVARTRPTRDAARSEADQAQGRIGANAVDAEVVAGLAERLAASRDVLGELERRAAIYQATYESIAEAERATLKTAARFLEERMGPTISHITDGRYDEVEVDETNLAFSVRTPESGELVSVERLSRGTADQLYLAARLGLVRLVTMDRRPPLILDDPFVTFDRGRGERALRLVKRLAAEAGFQVLYLTCSSRFDTLADKLVVLDPPSTDRVLASSTDAAPTPATEAEAIPAVSPAPTLTFAPDPRPNPDPVAPRVAVDQAGPKLPEAEPEAGAAADLRLDLGLEAGEVGAPDSGPGPDAGIVDPFRLDDSELNETAD